MFPGLAELLVKEAVCNIFLNPHIWVCTVYKVQRELYMFLIQQFDNDPRLLKSLCRLPRVLDIIHQFYCDNVKSQSFVGSNPLQLSVSEQVTEERREIPSKEEMHKIRLLLLSLGEMSLRYSFIFTFSTDIHVICFIFIPNFWGYADRTLLLEI